MVAEAEESMPLLPDSAPHPKLMDAPQMPGTLQVSARSLTDAITWITQTLREEQAARKSLEVQLASANSMAQNARDLASELAFPKAGMGEMPANGEALAQELRQMQAIVKNLQKNQDVHKKNQQACDILAEEKHAMQMSELRNELGSKATAEQLHDLRASIASQVRDAVATETRTLIHDRLARESENLRKRLEATSESLSRRLDVFAEQLSELTGEELEEEDDIVAALVESKVVGGVSAIDAPALEVQPAKTASIGGDSSPSSSQKGSGSPMGHGSLGNRVKHVEDKLQEMEALLEAAQMGGMDAAEEAHGASEEVAPVSQSGDGAQPSQPAVAKQQSGGGMVSMGMRLGKLESRIEVLETAPRPVSVTPATAAESSDSGGAAVLRLASIGDGEQLAITTPIQQPVLRTELINWVQGQLDDFKKSFPETSSNKEEISEAMDGLRQELQEWLGKQGSMQALETALQPRPSAPPEKGRSSSPAPSDRSAVHVSFSPHYTIADEVKVAVSDLRQDIQHWLESKLAGTPAAQFIADPPQAPSPPASEVRTVVSQATSADDPQAVMVSGDPVSVAAVALKEEISQWLESQLQAVQDMMIAHGDQPNQRDSVHGMYQPNKNALGHVLDAKAEYAVSEAASAKSEAVTKEPSQAVNFSQAPESTSPADSSSNSDNAAKRRGSAPAAMEQQCSDNAVERNGSKNSGRSQSRQSSASGAASRPNLKSQPSTPALIAEPDEDWVSDPHEIVKWFSSQLQELSNALQGAKAERDAKIHDSMTEIRGDLMQWCEDHMPKESAMGAPALGAGMQPPEERFEVPASGDEAAAPPVLSPSLSFSDSPTQKAMITRSSRGPGSMDEVRDALTKDEAFLSAIADYIDNGFEDGTEGGRRPSIQGPGRSSSKEGQLRSPLTPSRGGGKGVGGKIANLQERLATIEDLVVSDADSAGGGGGDNPSFMGLLQVGDELRRLKGRFEYLERVVPPDVQRALHFFEPMAADHTPEGLNGGTAAAMQKVHDLHLKQEQVTHEAKGLAEDSRREVDNVSRALRGMQKEAEVSGGKIQDIRGDLTMLRARLEEALPKVVKAIEDVATKNGLKPPELADLPAPAPATGKGRDAFITAGGSAGALVPQPFVSQDFLRQAMDSLQGDMQGWVDKLRVDLLQDMRGKADGEAVRSLAEQLAKQEQHKSKMNSALIDLQPSGSKAADAAGLRNLQARCVSCDGQVEVKPDPRTMWKPVQPAVPQPSFPHRGPPGKDLRPLGAGMQRNHSLPAIKAQGSELIGPSTAKR